MITNNDEGRMMLMTHENDDDSGGGLDKGFLLYNRHVSGNCSPFMAGTTRYNPRYCRASGEVVALERGKGIMSWQRRE